MLNVSAETERTLSALAEKRGLSVDAYLWELLNTRAEAVQGGGPVTGKEKAAEFVAWAETFPDTPLLSDDAISREGLYPDRW